MIFENEDLLFQVCKFLDFDLTQKSILSKVCLLWKLYIEHIRFQKLIHLKHPLDETDKKVFEYARRASINTSYYITESNYIILTKIRNLTMLNIFVHDAKIIFPQISELTNLKILDIYPINDTCILNIAFLTQLEKLKIGGSGSNYLKNINSISKLINLKQLSFEDCNYVGRIDFINLKNLTYLKIEDCDYFFNNALQNISKMTNLKSLNVHESYRISELCDDIPELNLEYISNLTQLETLKLIAIKNMVNTICLSKLSHLTDLDLSQSNITDIDCQFLTTLTRLKYLNLNHCTQITNINIVPTNLISFTANRSNILTPKYFPKLELLTINKCEMDLDFITNFPNLYELNITCTSGQILTLLTNLRSLRIEHLTTEVDLKLPTGLKVLHLGNFKLPDLNCLLNLKNLRNLSIYLFDESDLEIISNLDLYNICFYVKKNFDLKRLVNFLEMMPNLKNIDVKCVEHIRHIKHINHFPKLELNRYFSKYFTYKSIKYEYLYDSLDNISLYEDIFDYLVTHQLFYKQS